MADSVGQADLRAEVVSKAVTGFALASYKLKQLCTISPSSAWIESYYKETASELTGGTGNAVKGVPRLAAFPYGEATWTKVSSYIEKYGMEGVVSMEDSMTDNIDVIARTLLRIGRAVAYAVDSQIETAIRSTSGINSITLSGSQAWNFASITARDPIQNILNAKTEISDDNYDIDDGNGYLVVSPKDYAYLIGNSKVLQNPTFKASDVVSNGVVGQILGLKIIVSNTVTVSNAYVVKGKEALTWKESVPLTVRTIEDPGVKYTIRAWELGVCQVPNPLAICKIAGTQV